MTAKRLRAVNPLPSKRATQERTLRQFLGAYAPVCEHGTHPWWRCPDLPRAEVTPTSITAPRQEQIHHYVEHVGPTPVAGRDDGRRDSGRLYDDDPLPGDTGNQPCVECGVVDPWNFAVRHADDRTSVVCQDHGQDGLEGDEPL